MLIDWFTVAAQTLNFLLLVWLMKRFLYQPILRAINTREQMIAAELADAEAKAAQARQQYTEFEHKNQQIEQQRLLLLKQATAEAQAEAQKLLAEARKTAELLTEKHRQALKADTQNLNLLIRRRLQQEVFAIARQTLSDMASSSLEQQMAEVFIHRLHNLDEQTKTLFAQALKTAAEPACIRSTFELQPEQCATIQKSLNTLFSTETQLRFEVSPDLISGIELICNGQKLEWSIADYLLSMEQAIDELLNQNLKSETTS